MSYILDALKRADAERERGQVPGLHAQPIDNLASTRGPAVPRWAVYAGGGTALVIVAALAWRMGADAHAPVPAPLIAPEPAPAPVAAAPVPAPVPAPVVEAPAPAPAIEPAPPPVAHVAPPRPAPRPVPEKKPAPTRAAAPAPTYAPPPAPSPAPAQARAPEPAPAAAATIPMFAELPGSLRQQLPALTVTGSVYSDDASSRFIMLNGDVVKEGGQPAPGVVVERIEPKSAVLRFKGQRFRLPF